MAHYKNAGKYLSQVNMKYTWFATFRTYRTGQKETGKAYLRIINLIINMANLRRSWSFKIIYLCYQLVISTTYFRNYADKNKIAKIKINSA